MSKYQQRGAYHYDLFARKGDPYREHVLDLIEQIQKVVGPGADIFECGCGEGLILSQLTLRGYNCEGCDTDPVAIGLGKAKGNVVFEDEIFEENRGWDAVLLCDVLEHVKDPIAVMNHAKHIARVVVIAIPDRTDPNAINKITPEDLSLFMEGDPTIPFKLVHQSQRHARHLMIFKDDSP